MDENRRWFLGGWIDYCDNERGRAAPDPDDEAAMCGYNSGWIAARSKYDPTPEERASQFRDAVI